jgi:hypothetical protein
VRLLEGSGRESRLIGQVEALQEQEASDARALAAVVRPEEHPWDLSGLQPACLARFYFLGLSRLSMQSCSA